MTNRKTVLASIALGSLALCLFHVSATESAAAPQHRIATKIPARGQVRPHAKPGYSMKALPAGHTRVVVGKSTYYFHAGVFYRHSRGSYIVVRAPIGARVRVLPTGYVRFSIGSRRYFVVNDIYFLWDEGTREYVVVGEPENAADVLVTAQDSVTSNIYVYPREGQNDEEARLDRYECHVWAGDQTGFDPSFPNQDPAGRTEYNRAIAACLEGRGYTVK